MQADPGLVDREEIWLGPGKGSEEVLSLARGPSWYSCPGPGCSRRRIGGLRNEKHRQMKTS